MTESAKKTAVEKPALRLAIMVDSLLVNKPIYDFIQWAAKQDQLFLSHLIITKPSNNGNINQCHPFRSLLKRNIYDDVSNGFFSAVYCMEKMLLKTNNRYKHNYEKFNLSSLTDNIIPIYPINSNTHYRLFSNTEIKRVKDLDLDIIVKYSEHIFVGDIYNSARFGIISMQYGNNRYNIEKISGFWEVYSKQDSTSFAIKQLTEKIDGTKTLMRGQFRTQVFFLLNQAALHEKANQYLKMLLIKIAEQGMLPDHLPELPCSSLTYDIPKLHNSLYYLADLYYRLFVKALYRFLNYQRQWNVAFTYSHWRSAVLCQSVELKNPPNHFLADPFVISRFGKEYCFAEDYDYAGKKGCIVAYRIHENTSKFIGVAIDEPFHLSFPYLFEFQGDLYMCPETGEKKEIRVYKCVEFPCRWALESILMKDVAAVDTLLFEKQGKWWMLTNIDYSNTGDYGQTLSIFYADSPLSNNWKTHPKNPIYIDSSIARNAGLLRDGERLFRVAQAQGFDIYGKKTSLFEMTDINEFNFSETYVTEINPSFKKGIMGTHHFYSNGIVTVFDYLDYEFIKPV
ncbi:MAG: hypothetical protein ACNA7G_13320 [Methylobacter sp.]